MKQSFPVRLSSRARSTPWFTAPANTYFGKTASLVETAHTVSHFQQAVLKIGDYLIVIAVALVVLILVVALFRGDQMVTTLQFALVLTVAAIPVAMPPSVRDHGRGCASTGGQAAIVSRLASVEELAGMDVLCSDKTGTLTQNKLTLGEPFAVAGAAELTTLYWAAPWLHAPRIRMPSTSQCWPG